MSFRQPRNIQRLRFDVVEELGIEACEVAVYL